MIREFQDSDMDEVLSIWLEASVLAHHFVDRSFWEEQVDNMRDMYLPQAVTYVYDDGKVKGFLSLLGNNIAALFVSPDCQRQGIGTELVDEAKKGRPILHLAVFAENRSGILFYEKCGFQVVEKRLDINTGHHELIMAFNAEG